VLKSATSHAHSPADVIACQHPAKAKNETNMHTKRSSNKVVVTQWQCTKCKASLPWHGEVVEITLLC